MMATTTDGDLVGNSPIYDRKSELEEFDELKVGVQGLKKESNNSSIVNNQFSMMFQLVIQIQSSVSIQLT